MEPITVRLDLTKETKNTYRYDAADEDAAVTAIYVRKSALPDGPSDAVEITIQPMSL